MTDVEAIRAWVVARVDEDERVARAATPGRWQAGGTYGDWLSVLPRDHVLAPDYRPPGFSQGQHVADARVADGGMTAWAADLHGSGFPEGNAQHIALHDPARALREVEAKRRRLARHVVESSWRPEHGEPRCNWCEQMEPWPCSDLVDDAQAWADREDIPEELRLP